MNLEEQLLQTFATIAERIREEAERQVAEAIRPIVEAAATDRAHAAAEAAADARAAAEQAAAEMLANAEVRAREAGQAVGLAEGRRLGWDEGFQAGREEGRREGVEAGRRDGREEGREAGREEGREEGRREGRETGRQEGLEEGRQLGRAEGQDEARRAGREEGRAEGREEGRVQGREEGLAEGRAEAYARGLAEGQSRGAEAASAEAHARGHVQGLNEGYARGRDEGLAEGRSEGFAEGHARGREAGLAEGHDAGFAAGLARARQDALAQRQAESLAALLPSGGEVVERLLQGLQSLDGAGSLSAILDALAAAAACEAPRASVLLTSGGRARVWRSHGFDRETGQEPGGECALVEAGLIGEAASRGEVVQADSNTPGAVPALFQVPPGRLMVAVPVALSGQIVAVVYADEGTVTDEGAAASAAWPRATEIVARHAARCLESLTALRAAQFARGGTPWPAAPAPSSPPPQTSPSAPDNGPESARRYARLLLSEIKLYHEAAVAAGRREHDLARRLGGEIARARARYEQRVPADVQQSGDYFQEELVNTLANGDPALLGQVPLS